MTERLAGLDGKANRPPARLYRTFAQGGAGLLLTGNVLVDSRYLEAPGNVAIEDESGRAALAAWAAADKSRGCAVIMQINHAGRQAARSVARNSVAPSAVPLRMSRFFSTPREITATEILEVIERFGFAAVEAWRAGFDGFEVHAAHGYLLSQFLSPRVNRREDEWGGPIENRARIVVRICRRIWEVFPASFAVGVKLNVEDFIKGGLSPEDSLEVVCLIAPLGLDFIELSAGTHEYAVAFDGERSGEALFEDYVRQVRAVTQIPLILTGRMRSREGMTRVLAASWSVRRREPARSGSLCRNRHGQRWRNSTGRAWSCC